MDILKKLSLFIFCNAAGFMLPFFMYLLLIMKFRVVDIEAEGFDLTGFYYDISASTTEAPMPYMVFLPTLTWFICALFSFAFFFVGRKWKKLFLLAPLVMPALYSLVIVLGFM